jgi:hypothetical protein
MIFSSPPYFMDYQLKLIIFVISVLISSPLLAESSVRFDAYDSCPSETDALVCSSKCKKIKDIQFDFLLNVARSFVAIKTFEHGKITSVVSLDNCKVFDSKNWICELYNDKSKIRTLRSVMLDGVYSSQTLLLCAKP